MPSFDRNCRLDCRTKRQHRVVNRVTINVRVSIALCLKAFGMPILTYAVFDVCAVAKPPPPRPEYG